MKKETKVKIIKLSVIAIAIACLCLAVYLPLKLTGLLDQIDDIEHLREIIANGGIYSYMVFFIIQFLQVALIPIPAVITTLAGTLVFGPWIAMAISFAGEFTACIVVFFIGRKFGRKLVVWVIGESETEKWTKKLEKGKYVFFLMMLFPLFPDDILCLVVGATTSMSYRFFIITNILTRPPAIICTCFFGSGEIIPFSGWGIPVWIVLILLCALAFFLTIKYQSQIENYVTKLGQKLSLKKNKEPIHETAGQTETIKDNEKAETEKGIEN